MSRDLMIPLSTMPWGFFDRQRSLFSEIHKNMEDEFKRFDLELDRIRKDLFKLEPLSIEDFGKNMLQVENPIVKDSDGNKKLALRFDVSNFKPDEICVKTTDSTLHIQAKHEEKTPQKQVYREFSRHYTLPKSVDPLKLSSILTKDGVLHIEAPAPEAIEAPSERLIPIQKC
ncbi:heat shock protein Hsp-16.1/Hsp-16.11 [Octopus bimaculoides]|uniref:SHSP domain-containing protein n=1 Tax=Octopus bimaculoides TaxID=37653 RepID=A0A0L8GBA4_OCTBM|nr:heat shock protein Hsp-16.1/Hsp-16.11 [Octopus bimaculoides]|eukprot:XP_014782498.1 PREDICTED: heat shock protein Hsp-16.1/Hsp-16.11-like [Octopus bimaculoides]